MRTSLWQRWNPWLGGLAITISGLALTWTLSEQQAATSATTAQARFSEEVRSSTEAIRQRIAAYTEVANSARDMFLVDSQLTAEQFNLVAQAHDFRTRYPELRNLSFARWLTTDQLPEFEKKLQVQALHNGLATTQPIIHPQVAATNHYVIEFLWPQERNSGIFGLDIASQPANKAAVEIGRDTGKASISAPFDLVQEKILPRAILLRIPVFVIDLAPATNKAERRFIGSATTTIRVVEMLAAIHDQGYFKQIALRLEDIGTPDTPLSTPILMGEFGHFSAALEERQKKPSALQPSTQRLLDLHGRRWRVNIVATHPMLSKAERQLPYWIAGGGLLLSLLLGTLATLLLRQRAQALLLADRSLQDLQFSEARLQAMFDQAAVGVALIHTETGHFERANQKYCDILGYPLDELLQCNARRISLHEERGTDRHWSECLQRGEQTDWCTEKRLLKKDGQIIWVDLSVSPIHQNGHPSGYNMCVIQDISERQRMREALVSSEQRLRRMLDHLPVGVILVENEQNIIFRNLSFIHITGYDETRLTTIDEWWSHAYPDPHYQKRVQAHWQILIEKASLQDGIITASEYEIRKADGRCASLMISGVQIGQDVMAIFEDLSQHKAAAAEISYLSSFDTLTGLANRRQLLEHLNHAISAALKNSTIGALMMLDLDHFKTLNETRGHHYGDLLLRQVAERLHSCIPAEVTLARHGDDEFVLLLENLADHSMAAGARVFELAERILAALRTPFMLEDLPYRTTASLGATLFQGQGESVDELLQRVDLAMMQAKTQGRDCLQFYDPQMQTAARARALREHDLRLAMETGQFELFYQAQVHDDRITGAEALLRWRHPEEGYVSPAEFIPLAEETGMILPLGRWVLDTACQQLALWSKDSALAKLNLAVNISPRQFYQTDFVAQVLAALAGHDTNARHLELELTESLLLQNVDDTVAKMNQLKAYGLEFSLDDFGTGYSSLAYLKRLPLDQLKIDQSFVRDILTDPNDATIARTIIALAHNLGLRVIAEGVETAAQRDFLQQHGCNHWQGYLYSKPLPLADFEALVRTSNETVQQVSTAAHNKMAHIAPDL